MILSDNFEYDMSSWLNEKAGNVISAFIELLKELEKENDLKVNNDYLKILSSNILYDLTKIYSFSSNSEWRVDDNLILINDLNEGFEKLKLEYGIIDKTKKQIYEEELSIELDQLIAKIKKHLQGERAPNRTLLHDIFYRTQLKHPALKKIEDELFMVTNNELDWAIFLEHTKTMIDILNLDRENVTLKKNKEY